MEIFYNIIGILVVIAAGKWLYEWVVAKLAAKKKAKGGRLPQDLQRPEDK